MKSLADYVKHCGMGGRVSYSIERSISEGGMGGHMAHPIDYDDLTCASLCDMAKQLLSNKVVSMKEKLDGTNIQATVNKSGNVVFIRNKGDLNSANGGMSISEMAEKWKDKPSVAANYIKAGHVIKKIFDKMPKSFFIPSASKRVIVNCECISAGQTNVMLYDKDRVAFHGTAEYEYDGTAWRLVKETEGEPQEIRKAAFGIDEAMPRPQLVVNDVIKADNAYKKAESSIISKFKYEGLGKDATIYDYKKARYMQYAPEWAKNEQCFKRIICNDKTVSLRILKDDYPELKDFETSPACQKLQKLCIEPLDTWMAELGNDVIEILDGLTNAGNEEHVITALKNQLEETAEEVENNGSDRARQVMAQSLQRLEKLGKKVNAAEGIVFEYNGKLMKLTGSFSALNQALGVRFMK